MSFLSVKNVKIKGMSACVPETVVETRDYTLLSKDEIQKFIDTTGIERRRVVNKNQCTSDLCLVAAEKLIKDLGWKKDDIDLLVFASHTGDYKLPSTSCILQDKLGLPTSCMAFDISHGCSGFVYGLGIISNLLATGSFKKGLLLVGNTQSKNVSYEDQSTYLIFGDAGTATALEYSAKKYDEMDFHFFTDGSERDSVYVPDGGYRNPITPDSFIMEEFENGIRRNRTHIKMDGANVFSYAYSNVPKSVNSLVEHFHIEKENIDYLVMHQANKFLCEKLRKKVNIAAEKVPYSFKDFGNSSGGSIPLTMVTKMADVLKEKKLELLMTTIGGGFSIASARLKVCDIYCTELLTLNS